MKALRPRVSVRRSSRAVRRGTDAGEWASLTSGEGSEIEARLIDLESARARGAIALSAFLQGKGGGKGEMGSEQTASERRGSQEWAVGAADEEVVHSKEDSGYHARLPEPIGGCSSSTADACQLKELAERSVGTV